MPRDLELVDESVRVDHLDMFIRGRAADRAVPLRFDEVPLVFARSEGLDDRARNPPFKGREPVGPATFQLCDNAFAGCHRESSCSTTSIKRYKVFILFLGKKHGSTFLRG